MRVALHCMLTFSRSVMLRALIVALYSQIKELRSKP